MSQLLTQEDVEQIVHQTLFGSLILDASGYDRKVKEVAQRICALIERPEPSREALENLICELPHSHGKGIDPCLIWRGSGCKRCNKFRDDLMAWSRGEAAQPKQPEPSPELIRVSLPQHQVCITCSHCIDCQRCATPRPQP